MRGCDFEAKVSETTVFNAELLFIVRVVKMDVSGNPTGTINIHSAGRQDVIDELSVNNVTQ